jgi:hypothetical protein
MTTDALVQWAWNPGARTAPPVTQADFHEAVRRWVATGAACPRWPRVRFARPDRPISW